MVKLGKYAKILRLMYKDSHSAYIEIIDNAGGIKSEVIDKVDTLKYNYV